METFAIFDCDTQLTMHLVRPIMHENLHSQALCSTTGHDLPLDTAFGTKRVGLAQGYQFLTAASSVSCVVALTREGVIMTGLDSKPSVQTRYLVTTEAIGLVWMTWVGTEFRLTLYLERTHLYMLDSHW